MLESFFNTCYNRCMFKHVVALVLIAILFSGCIWPFSSLRPRSAMVGNVPEVVSLEVLDPVALKNAGKVYFMPLSAGQDAEAGDALDRVALMMVKGCSDAFDQSGQLKMLAGDEAGDADLVIKGRMETLKLVGGGRLLAMKVRVDVRAASTDQVLAVVYAQREAAGRQVNADQASYDIGYALGQKLTQ